MKSWLLKENITVNLTQTVTLKIRHGEINNLPKVTELSNNTAKTVRFHGLNSQPKVTAIVRAMIKKRNGGGDDDNK